MRLRRPLQGWNFFLPLPRGLRPGLSSVAPLALNPSFLATLRELGIGNQTYINETQKPALFSKNSADFHFWKWSG